MTTNKITLASTLAITSFLSLNVLAADTLLLTGVSGGDSSYYAYVGAIVPIAGSDLESDGWRLRAWGFHQGFDYNRGNLSGVKAEGGGVEFAAGHQWTLGKSKVTGYLGLAYRDIDTSPDNSPKINGAATGIKGQLEIQTEISNSWNVSFIGSYTGGDSFDDTYLNISPSYKINDRFSLGPAFTYIAGAEGYDATKVGIALNTSIGSKSSLGLSAGVLGGDSEGGYLGINLSTAF